jgi:hypothetical protein
LNAKTQCPLSFGKHPKRLSNTEAENASIGETLLKAKTRFKCSCLWGNKARQNRNIKNI